jgi:predicted NBD/HSP70 family sugar kinase
MIAIQPRLRPPLDPGFLPAALWNRAYHQLARQDRGARRLILMLLRADGSASGHESLVLAAGHPAAPLNFRYAERLLKFLLWQKGGCRVLVAGAPEIAAYLVRVYSPRGKRAFDHAFMGEKVYGRTFTVEAVPPEALPAVQEASLSLGRHRDGCRIGFDLGGSDRKVAALIDGRVVHSEEIPWDPYFQSDPRYHVDGVDDLLRRAAARLPRVDAIGGSAAGIYVNNEVRVASLFRGVPPDLFEKYIRRMFPALQQRWGGVPFVVANDGEVTALAGSMAIGDHAVLGISMGTSQAGGYVTPAGRLTPWLNELAFAPVDYRDDAPRDEWSGDIGCGVQYFSQQGVGRLARLAGLAFPDTMPLPEQLVAVQGALASGDSRARFIYESIGVCFGYALAHYVDFYPLRHVLVLGRVTSGEGGAILLTQARAVLHAEFPELADRIQLHMPNEKDKRYGQAIAAASLPEIKGITPQPPSSPSMT